MSPPPQDVPCHTQRSHRSLFISCCWESREGVPWRCFMCRGRSAAVESRSWGVPRQCHTSRCHGAMAVPPVPGWGAMVGCSVSCDRGAVSVLLCRDLGRSAGVSRGRVWGATPVPGFGDNATRARGRVPRQRHGSASCPGLTVLGLELCQLWGAMLNPHSRWQRHHSSPSLPPTCPHPQSHSGSETAGNSTRCPAARGTRCPPCGSPAPRRASAPPPAPWRW